MEKTERRGVAQTYPTPSGLEVEVIHLEEELSAADLRALAQHCFRQAQEGRPQVVVDMAAVEHLDYRGVGALRAARELLLRAGGDLKLAGLSPYLGAILRAAGAHGAFELFATAEAARSSFAGDGVW